MLIKNNDYELSKNQLESLPKSFGTIEIRGDLNLSKNQLKSLPESFGTLSIKYIQIQLMYLTKISIKKA